MAASEDGGDQVGPSHLILELITAFYWFDEGLQNYLRRTGWPEITRPQSMLMCNLALGLRRPSEIARRLGVSRQAVHATLAQMIDKRVLDLVEDSEDRRIKVVVLTTFGEAMRREAQEAMRLMVEELEKRIGAGKVANLRAALLAGWGEPVSFDDVAPQRS